MNFSFNKKSNKFFILVLILLLLVPIFALNGMYISATRQNNDNSASNQIPFSQNNQPVTSKIDSINSLNSSLVSISPGDYMDFVINTSSAGFFNYNVTFMSYINQDEVNSSIVVNTNPIVGNSTNIINGNFVLNTTSGFIPSTNGIPTWTNTSFTFWVDSNLSVGSHLSVGNDTSATVVSQFNYNWQGLTYNVFNISFLDFGVPAYGLYESSTGIMLYYYQFSTGYYGWLNTTSLITINPKYVLPYTISNNGPISFNYGSTGNYASFTIIGPNPNLYTLYQNGSIINSGPWTSGTPLNFNLDSLTVGNWNFTIVANDTLGNTLTSTVMVNVLANSPPIITNPSNISYYYGASGNIIKWVVKDTNPSTYIVYKNGSLYGSGLWGSGSPINIGVDGLNNGLYNFTIIVNDTLGLTAVATVWVSVTPQPTNPQTSNTQTSNTQTSNTQTSNTQTSNTQKSNTTSASKSSTITLSTPGFEVIILLGSLFLGLFIRKRRKN